MKHNRDFSCNFKVSYKDQRDFNINLMYMLQRRTPVLKKYPRVLQLLWPLQSWFNNTSNPASTRQTYYPSLVPKMANNLKKNLTVPLCLQTSGWSWKSGAAPRASVFVLTCTWNWVRCSRFRLLKVTSLQSDWPRNIHYRRRHQRRATGNSWRVPWRKRR